MPIVDIAVALFDSPVGSLSLRYPHGWFVTFVAEFVGWLYVAYVNARLGGSLVNLLVYVVTLQQQHLTGSRLPCLYALNVGSLAVR